MAGEIDFSQLQRLRIGAKRNEHSIDCITCGYYVEGSEHEIDDPEGEMVGTVTRYACNYGQLHYAYELALTKAIIPDGFTVKVTI